jgi:O-antigen/teichoic acid export membrane protein
MIPSFFALFILSQSNNYLLAWLSGLSEVGIYIIGYNVGSTIQLLINAFQNAWTPYFLSFIDKQKLAYFHFAEVKKYYIVFVCLLVTCFFAYSKLALMIFLTETYLQSFRIIGFVALANFFTGLFYILLPPLYFEKEVKYVSVIQAFTAGISIILNVILISYLGAFGAGIGLALAHYLIFQFLWLFNRYRSRSHLRNYNPTKVNKFFLSYSIIILLSLIPRNWGVTRECIYASSMILLLVLLTYRLLNKEEKTNLRKFLLNFSQ